MEGPAELGSSRLAVAHRIRAHYAEEYAAIFGVLPDLEDASRFPPQAMPLAGQPDHPWARAWQAMDPSDREAVNRVFANVGKAIAAYERKLLPGEAPFDAYVAALLAGDPRGGGHLTPAAERGLAAFTGPAGCIHCHNGPLLSDHGFHNVGLRPDSPDQAPDIGRARGARDLLADEFNSAGPYSDSAPLPDLVYLNPDFRDFLGAFKTPTLRNVGATAPYGHNGQFPTLGDVLDWYRELPRVPLAGHRDLILKVLPGEVSTGDLTAFLESLTGALPAARWLHAPADPQPSRSPPPSREG